MLIIREYQDEYHIHSSTVAALAIDKVGPRPYNLPLREEAKNVKSPWSIVLLSCKVILSV